MHVDHDTAKLCQGFVDVEKNILESIQQRLNLHILVVMEQTFLEGREL